MVNGKFLFTPDPKFTIYHLPFKNYHLKRTQQILLNMNAIRLLFILLLSTYYLSAQSPLLQKWNNRYGTLWEDDAAQVIQNIDGGLTFVGSTKPIYKKGYDIYFVSTDLNGNVIEEQRIGRRADDGGTDLVQCFDGGYAIAGFTESDAPGYNGKRDGWVIKVDKYGNRIWDTLLGTYENDELTSIVQADDGNLWATGTFAGQVALVRLNSKGQIILKKTLAKGIGKKLIATEDGNWLITGYDVEGEDSNLLMIKVNASGVPLWKESISNAKGIDAILDGDGYAIAGIAHTREGREDMFLIKTNDKGKEIWKSSFGGRGLDGANALIKDEMGYYYIVGYSTSHGRGARREKLWLHKVNAAGIAVWKEPLYIGGKESDIGTDIVQLHNGQLVLSGYTASDNSNNKDAWLIKLASKEATANRGIANLTIQQQGLKEDNNNNAIDPEERGNFQLLINNSSKHTAYQVQLKVVPQQVVKGLSFQETVTIGSIPAGTNKIVSIPFAGSELMKKGESSFSVKVQAKNAESQSLTFKVNSQQRTHPQLAIIQSAFDKAQVQKGKVFVYAATIKNMGDATAKNVRVKLSYPYKIKSLSTNLLELGDLGAKQSKEVKFQLVADRVYLEEQIAITLRVVESTNQFGATKEANIAIQKEIPIAPVAPPAVTIEKKQLDLFWISPNPDEYQSQSLSWEESTITIKLKAVSSKPLTEQHFSIIGQTKGKKMDKVKLLPAPNNSKGRYSYTYTTTVTLKEGNNQIVVKVQNGVGERKSSSLVVNHNPVKPNLYILAAGVPHPDLQYASKDAADFVRAFEQQKGKLFNQIDIQLHNTPKTTTSRELNIAIQQMANKYLIDQITEKDVLILFFSSHGIEDKKRKNFYIAGSDLDDVAVKQTSIDFKNDVLSVLDEVKCKKLILIDACQSGAINQLPEGAKGTPTFGSINEAIIRIANAKAGYRHIVSSAADEFSYEDPSWENGAFTEAILEALANQSATTKSGSKQADQNKDQLLTVTELYEFIAHRVPYLVQKEKKEAQHPHMTQAHREADFPLFYLKGK